MIPSLPTPSLSPDGVPPPGSSLHSFRKVSWPKRTNAVVEFEPHNGSAQCGCPFCKVLCYISFLYSGQQRSSEHILKARPSPYLTSPLPDLPKLECPSGVERCPILAAFGFCPFGDGCHLPHPPKSLFPCNPFTPRLTTAEDELHRLGEKARWNVEREVWNCGVCGHTGIGEFQVLPVGEMFFYRYCDRCSFPCYQPNVSYLVDSLLEGVGDDYLLYKDAVEAYRTRLPEEFKVPFSFEANRVGTAVFAWSLVSPEQVKYAVESACRALPTAREIMSMGSGGGYVEHIFNRILHDVHRNPEWEIDREKYPRSYFDGVKANLNGMHLPIYAFDELALRKTYSVHVSVGDPLTVLSATRNTILLLCWPPFGSPQEEQSSMAFETLEYFTQRGGEVVIYIGDVASTGDWRFHESLQAGYKLVKDYSVRHEIRRWCPQEMGLVYAGNDTIGVYRRRQ